MHVKDHTSKPGGIPKGESRIRVAGKFLMQGDQKFLVKGVTYGTFRPGEDGTQFPDIEAIRNDFRLMAESGINCVRTYTIPPIELLDAASTYHLKVMVGLPWEQHITFLDNKACKDRIIASIQKGVSSCNRHPALLCFAIGNEIPGSIVRWYGKRRIERFLHELYRAVKTEDAAALVTYVNYPTTEFLDLPFLDFNCFNVYLENREKLSSYLLRLQNLTGDKPLVLAEIGLDSRRNGVQKQAEVLQWQLETLFSYGCAGTFLFAWTDEWWRGGFDIEDWDFGLVSRNRIPKPALEYVSAIYRSSIPPFLKDPPLISVVVCSYNGSATVRDTIEALGRLDYKPYEIIFVNDGSTDNTEEIVASYNPAYGINIISQENKGLSAARNSGIEAAKGEIVAFIDDDAYPDPLWLRYLAYAYRSSSHAGIGGPNIAPGDDGPIANCVALSPGGPVHVLLSDEIAEHIPGCNMSFRKEVLVSIGGFDPVYRAAGDDVDLCWRVQLAGHTIGFHPSAFVWHHRRNSIRAYWKQQKGYGKAEALLENKWPERYNSFGHVSWSGRIYGNGLTLPLQVKKEKVFYGTWGSALFQSVYKQDPHVTAFLPMMPEWYLVIAFLGGLSLMGFLWQPLFMAFPLLLISLLLVLIQAGISAYGAVRYSSLVPKNRETRYWMLTTYLHALQPIARLYGRIRHGLTPWRKTGMKVVKTSWKLPFSTKQAYWSEQWQSIENWLGKLEKILLENKVRCRRGGAYDRWDVAACCGFFSSSRGLIAIEEHGAGKQYVRFRTWTHMSAASLIFMTTPVIIAIIAWFSHAYVVAAMLGVVSLFMMVSCFMDACRSCNDLTAAFDLMTKEHTPTTDTVTVRLASPRQKPETAKKIEPIIPTGYEMAVVDAGSSRNPTDERI